MARQGVRSTAPPLFAENRTKFMNLGNALGYGAPDGSTHGFVRTAGTCASIDYPGDGTVPGFLLTR
jgi:hypothetical protein